jgi:hypothetical protein
MQEPVRITPATWAGITAILLIVGLAVTSSQGPSSRWHGWRRQLRADAAHHALMEQQDSTHLSDAKRAQLQKLRARFLQEGEAAPSLAALPDLAFSFLGSSCWMTGRPAPASKP